MDYEIIIIGAGAVGLACAAELSKKARALVVERHESFGMETSSRNSEVIHAGIYYPENSLKAKLCVEGNRMLYEYCGRRGVPHKRIGKYIVAVDEGEIDAMENIYSRGKSNDVMGLRHANGEEIAEREPYVKARAGLFSADSGIVDSHKLMVSMQLEAVENDCDFAWKHSAQNIEKISGGFELTLNDPENQPCKIKCEKIINSAGLRADAVAEQAGIDVDNSGYRLHWARGRYFRIKDTKKYLAKRLIYPIPPKKMQNLGAHITVEMDGGLKLGPDIEYLSEKRQDYSVDESLREKFFYAATHYLKGLELDDLSPDQAGIRPKLQPPGGEYRDFVIVEESERELPGLVNLIGIESPGLTSCLAIAKYVENILK